MIDTAMYSPGLQMMRESLVWRINESRVQLVELATLPAEMAILAAQQVNEVRLSAIESPKDVGWGDIAFEFAIAFAINSSFVEKIAAKIFQNVYGRLLSNKLALAGLPKSMFAKKLLDDVAEAERNVSAYLAQAVRAGDAVAAARRLTATVEATKQLTMAESALSRELGKYAKLNSMNKEDVKLYAGWINELGTEKKNAAALAKATKDAAKKGGSKQPSTLSTTDGSSVTVVEHFSSAARAQRLSIESLHNQYEYIARVLPLSSLSFTQLHEMFDMNLIFDSQKEATNLDEMAAGMRLRMEAMIWAMHLGFGREQKRPGVVVSSRSYDVFDPTIDPKIVEYLFERFGKLIETWTKERGNPFPLGWDSATTGAKGLILREYFWSITDEFK